ncbi:MAG: preprotein translocase subunit YajC [Clostridiales bacterium]|jgi:preprotein translocase subunit YajC|nr:preprotein translocase subunit YajC [Clostridiales bacterium]
MDTLYTLMPLILLILIMYFLLIRPQKKREKQINAMRSSIKVGDEIITIGGIYGKVVRVKDEQLIIQVGADKTRIEIARWAISKVVSEEPASSKPVDKDEPKEKTKQARPKRLEKVNSSDTESDPPENNPLESEEKENNPLEEE